MKYITRTLVGMLTLGCLLTLSNCNSSTETSSTKNNTPVDTAELTLTDDLAKHIFTLPVHCIPVEYPNKLGQTLGSDQDLKTPKALRPVFYGCFDWHSAVHGYWSVVTLMQRFPTLDQDGKVRALLNSHITPEHVAVELAFFNDQNNLSFERTYGWAWLFKLQESLAGWNDVDAQRWKRDLQPLVDVLVERFIAYLPKQTFPLRVGQHNNTAFALSLSLDYARSVGNKTFEASLVNTAKELFLNDKNCNLDYEPSGHDFLSPCFEEAYLMSKVLPKEEYRTWLMSFIPSLFDQSLHLKPVSVTDRTDGHLVHLDGLNYSKGACLLGIAKTLPELSYLRHIAVKHISFSLPNLSTQDHYMGSHWLGTFALYAMLKTN